ncbi:MAG: helix-turn-helix transcriptional regulator [Oscillatoriophycideae cyanobacterium NC_groundwater_1537_Pr4_S-0.65um_50_18]|nr:helix-turn-helix transcriptional regulator [Oscillatoriophycideae cyanobacterium NC_groundwater_1537_Pr4_S-0.65um_50_18]
MKTKVAEISVHAWKSDGILLERYGYTSGSVEPLPKHCHEEYQFGLSFNCQGEYSYRGATHVIPMGSLSMIHSGEVHSPSDRTYLAESAQFEMIHIHPKWLQTVADEIAEKSVSLLFFSTSSLADTTLNHLFLSLQSTIYQRNSELDRDVALWMFLSYLIRHYASLTQSISPLKTAIANVMRTRDYLHAHYAEDVSLETLAAIAGLSRFHFCRVFRNVLGVTPNVYQTQLRIAEAKKLLLQGISIAAVSEMTGFYDQSHFGLYFKRLVGVTPKGYARKIAIFS